METQTTQKLEVGRQDGRRRIVWLAAADARGHLVRAHVMRKLLAAHGIDVHIFTTSQRGVEFLDEFGTPAALLEGDYQVQFDDRQNLDVSGTARSILRYLGDPDQFATHLDRLRTAGEHALCVVNDFHPALLVGGLLEGAGAPVVHLFGAHLWEAIARPFRRPSTRWMNPVYDRLLEGMRRRGAVDVVHEPLAPFGANWKSSDRVELPPLVPGPGRVGKPTDEESGGDTPKRIAVYLNPHFEDEAIARSVERLAERHGAELHAVGEGYAHRDAWLGCDPEFARRVAESDLLVSAPGAGAIGLSRVHETPLLMLLTDQPEQRENARRYLAAVEGPPRDAVEIETPRLHRALHKSAEPLFERADRPASRRGKVDEVHRAWSNAFRRLVRQLRGRDGVRAA